MAKMGRRRRSAAAWQALVTRQASSGESVARFCARERLSAASFYQWRSRLRGNAMAAAQCDEAPTPAGFVDLGDVSLGTGRMVLRLELGGGLVLQLTRG
jgi:hypothetical protein